MDMEQKGKKQEASYRKAPQAPRRFKSISKMQEYKKAFKNTKVTSFSSQISKEWKAMSEKEREKWKDMAEQDKIRFDAEKSQYTGPWVVPSDSIRKKRPKDAPRRPPSAFLNYCQRRRSELKKENPDVRNTDISKLLGEEWKKAPANVRQPHIDKEACEREEYYRKVATWRRRQSEEADTTGRCIGDTMMPCSEAGLSIKISPSPPTLDASNTTIVDISPGGNGESSPAPMQKSEHELLLQMPSSGNHECKAPSLPSWDGEANVGDSVVDDALIPTVFPPLAVRKFLSQPSLAADPNREFQEQDIPDFGIPFALTSGGKAPDLSASGCAPTTSLPAPTSNEYPNLYFPSIFQGDTTFDPPWL